MLAVVDYAMKAWLAVGFVRATFPSYGRAMLISATLFPRLTAPAVCTAGILAGFAAVQTTAIFSVVAYSAASATGVRGCDTGSIITTLPVSVGVRAAQSGSLREI